MFYFLIFATRAALDLPLLDAGCTQTEVLNPYNYTCQTCPTFDAATSTCPELTCGAELVNILGSCVSRDEYNKLASSIIQNDATIPFMRVRTGLETYETVSAQLSTENIELIRQYGAVITLAGETDNSRVREGLASMCALSHVHPDYRPCLLYTEGISQQLLGNLGYNYWPQNGPWLIYNNSLENEILREQYIESEFNHNTVVTIYLATFNVQGDFKGFQELTIDLERCSVKNEYNQIWRKFGSNYYSNCYIDLYEELNHSTADIYEPFLVDNYDQGNGSYVLRPIPLLDLAYANGHGQLVNTLDDPSYHVYTRRFFIRDNFTSVDYVQFLQNFTLEFTLNRDLPSGIENPRIIVDYVQHLKSNIHELEPSYDSLSDSLTTPFYSFRSIVMYDMTKFWDIALILLIIMIILILVAVIFRIFTFVKRHSGDGVSAYIILGIIRYIFDYFGNGLFLLVFGFAVYYWGFFKLQRQITTCLPPGEEFENLIPMIWACFCFKFVACVLQIIMNTSTDMFLVDWETPHNDDQEISAWRRIMVANQWSTISTSRAYSIPFTLIVFLFIQIGFNVDLLASPIPDTTLIDTGISQPILRVGWTSFLFLCLAVVQFIWCEFIYWRFGGDPFLNFVDVCSTSNISVMVIESPQYGYYIHGRSVHAHCDETMPKLNQNLTKEALGVAGTRGLLTDDKKQIYEVFYEHDFRQKFMQVYYSVQAQTGGSLFKQTAATIPQACIGAYADLNKMLTRFFDLSQSEYRADVQVEVPFSQSVLGISPSTDEASVLAPAGDRDFHTVMLYGIQWSLYVFYVILFCGIDMHIHNPAIAAFVVYIVDLIVVLIFKIRSKANLARKSLLDNRFLD